MNKSARTQWQIRCAFNGYCKKLLKLKAKDYYDYLKHRCDKEVSFFEKKLFIFQFYTKAELDSTLTIRPRCRSPPLLTF